MRESPGKDSDNIHHGPLGFKKKPYKIRTDYANYWRFPKEPLITKARFCVTFSDSDKPRTVTIKPPNEAQYMRDDDSILVEKLLKARGVILKPGKPQTGKTNHEPAHYEPATEKVLVLA
jgi:hypothetical protein